MIIIGFHCGFLFVFKYNFKKTIWFVQFEGVIGFKYVLIFNLKILIFIGILFIWKNKIFQFSLIFIYFRFGFLPVLLKKDFIIVDFL